MPSFFPNLNCNRRGPSNQGPLHKKGVGAAVVPFDLLCPLFAAFSDSPLKLLQLFLLVSVQPFPVDRRALR